MGAEDSYGSAPAPFCPRAAAGRGRLPGSACFALRKAGGRNGTKAAGNDGESAPYVPSRHRLTGHTDTHRAPRPAAPVRNPAAPDPAKSPGAAERPAGGRSAGPAAPLRSAPPAPPAPRPPAPPRVPAKSPAEGSAGPGGGERRGGRRGGSGGAAPGPGTPRGERPPPASPRPAASPGPSSPTGAAAILRASWREGGRKGGGGEGAEGGEEGSGRRACTARDGLRGAAATGGRGKGRRERRRSAAPALPEPPPLRCAPRGQRRPPLPSTGAAECEGSRRRWALLRSALCQRRPGRQEGGRERRGPPDHCACAGRGRGRPPAAILES